MYSKVLILTLLSSLQYTLSQAGQGGGQAPSNQGNMQPNGGGGGGGGVDPNAGGNIGAMGIFPSSIGNVLNDAINSQKEAQQATKAQQSPPGQTPGPDNGGTNLGQKQPNSGARPNGGGMDDGNFMQPGSDPRERQMQPPNGEGQGPMRPVPGSATKNSAR